MSEPPGCQIRGPGPRSAGSTAGRLTSGDPVRDQHTLAAAYEVNRIDECHIAARSAVNLVAVAVAGIEPVANGDANRDAEVVGAGSGVT